MTSWIEEVAPAHVRALDVYQPGKPVEELERELGITGALKVASNENPLGPSARAVAAMKAALDGVNLYPDAGGVVLRRALSARLGVAPERIILGGGSNELLYQLVLAFCAPDDEVVSHEAAFLSYRLSAQVAGRRFVAARCTPERSLDVDALIACFSPRTKLVMLGTPNNPTGSIATRAQVARVLDALPARALLVLDEAYGEYAAAYDEPSRSERGGDPGGSAGGAGGHPRGIDRARGEDVWADRRVIALRTFSKIYGLAGVRVGYGVGDPQVIEMLGRVGRTFNVSTLAQVAALAALDDDAHVARSAVQAKGALARLRDEVRGPGVIVYPTYANFALIETGRPSEPLYDALLRRGVIVRPMAAWGLPTCLRVSVAADAQMARVIEALNAVLA